MAIKKTKATPSVLLLDIAQHSNAGDDIMQVALISLVKKYISNNILAMSYFGSNEFRDVESEFLVYKEKYNVDVNGGVVNTCFKRRSSLKIVNVGHRFFNLLSILFFIFLVRIGFQKLATFISLNKKQKETLKVILNADLVIWNGRNFRGGRNKIAESLKILELCINPLICIALGKPVYCVGASVWPLKSSFSKFIMRYMVKKTCMFLVRERNSEIYLTSELKISNKSVLRMPDLSFYVLNELLSNDKELSPNPSSKTIAITLVGRREFESSKAHASYISAFSSLINHIDSKGFGIKIIPQVTYDAEPYDVEVNYLIENNPHVDFKIINKRLGLTELLYEYCQSGALVASRMHSAIFATACGVPVTAVSYDSGGKWSILDDLNVPIELVVNAENITSKKLIENFEASIVRGKTLDRADLTKLALECETIFKTINSSLKTDIAL